MTLDNVILTPAITTAPDTAMRRAGDLARLTSRSLHRLHLKEITSMLQLRIYTLRSADALQRYATIHWARHLSTFTTFGVTTYGVFTEQADGANRLVALIGYPQGADPENVTQKIMASPEFDADMAGFDRRDILDVQSVLLDPTSYSPLQQRN